MEEGTWRDRRRDLKGWKKRAGGMEEGPGGMKKRAGGMEEGPGEWRDREARELKG